jgi:hypothetical protein
MTTRFGAVRLAWVLAAAPRPRYGFRFDADRTGYVVDEEEVRIVGRILEMVEAQACSLHTVSKILEREGVPAPSGGVLWSRMTIRNVIKDDVYRPHTFEEIEGLGRWGLSVPCTRREVV